MRRHPHADGLAGVLQRDREALLTAELVDDDDLQVSECAVVNVGDDLLVVYEQFPLRLFPSPLAACRTRPMVRRDFSLSQGGRPQTSTPCFA